MGNLKEVLENVLKRITLKEKEYKKIEEETKSFVAFLKKRIKELKWKADVFVGGSYAKGTLIKKKKQDIDIFIRFSETIPKGREFEKIVKRYKGFYKRKIHGSRDYLRLEGDEINFEIIPVRKINKTEEAENVTDLSFLHVSYVKKKIEKQKNLKNEIMLAKTFCYAQNCYGAESYISGFSGYALELLVIYFKSFKNMLERLTRKKKKKKLVIDLSRHYKGEEDVLTNLNEAKLKSPIILVDPTYKQRNVLAALSEETFAKFQNSALNFLKKPSVSYFKKKKINTKKYDICLRLTTNKQDGAVVGSKFLKFHEFLSRSLEKYFYIKEKAFAYEGGREALSCFKLKPIKERIIKGPPTKRISNMQKFKKKHKFCFVKNGRIYAKEKVDFDEERFLFYFLKKNENVIKAMGISKIKKLD